MGLCLERVDQWGPETSPMHRANEGLWGVMAAWNAHTAVRPCLFVEAQAEFFQHLTSQFYHTASLAVNRLMKERAGNTVTFFRQPLVYYQGRPLLQPSSPFR